MLWNLVVFGCVVVKFCWIVGLCEFDVFGLQLFQKLVCCVWVVVVGFDVDVVGVVVEVLCGFEVCVGVEYDFVGVECSGLSFEFCEKFLVLVLVVCMVVQIEVFYFCLVGCEYFDFVVVYWVDFVIEYQEDVYWGCELCGVGEDGVVCVEFVGEGVGVYFEIVVQQLMCVVVGGGDGVVGWYVFRLMIVMVIIEVW